MSWITVDEMNEHLPLDVFDVNAMRIERNITGFNCVTGEVESAVLNEEGRMVFENGDVLKRREQYAAPLTWKSIKLSECKDRRYWDQDRR